MKKCLIVLFLTFGFFGFSPQGRSDGAEIVVDKDANLVRAPQEGFSLKFSLEDFTVSLGYEEREELFGPQSKRYLFGISRDLKNQRFSLFLRSEEVPSGKNLGGHLFYEQGGEEELKRGFELVYAKKDFNEFLIFENDPSHARPFVVADSQGYLRLFVRTTRGIEFSVFSARNGTADVTSGAKTFAKMPASTLFGERTLADAYLGEDVVQNFYGASVRFASEEKNREGLFYGKKGSQHIRGLSRPDEFAAFGGFIRSRGVHLSENLELDVSDLQTVDSVFYESRLLFDFMAEFRSVEFGFGAYSRGISTEFDPSLFLHFYDSAGGGLLTSFRITDRYRLGFWGMGEDNAPHFHKVLRGALFLKTPHGEFGLGKRIDRQGMIRFENESEGYFLTLKSRYADGIFGIQAGEPYGTLSLRIRDSGKSAKNSIIPFSGARYSLLPANVSRYAENPLVGSTINVEWTRNNHTGSLYTRQSIFGLNAGGMISGEKYRFVEHGGRYVFSSPAVDVETTFALRDISGLGVSEPIGRAAVLRQFGSVGVGVGWLKEVLFDESFDARFLFFRMPLGVLDFESAIGEERGGLFVSGRVSLGIGSLSGELLPTHLLPKVGRAKTESSAESIPGPERLWINVHNCGQECAARALPYLLEYRTAYTGVRTAPRLVCDKNSTPGPHCFEVNPDDPLLTGVLDIYGPNGVFVLVDDDLNSRPYGKISPEGLYLKMKNTLLFDERIVNVQCLGEPLNSGNILPEEYVRVYLPECVRAAEDVNKTRSQSLQATVFAAAPFGSSAGSRENQRIIRSGILRYPKVALTCHVYAASEKEALRLTRECKADAHGRLIALTESNFADGGMGSRYSKHAWWLGEVMPKIEKILAEGLDRRSLKKQINVFYTLDAHEDAEFPLIQWDRSGHWTATSDAHKKIIEARDASHRKIAPLVSAATEENAEDVSGVIHGGRDGALRTDRPSRFETRKEKEKK